MTSKNLIINNLDEMFTMMALNVVWQMTASHRFNYHENGMKSLLHNQQNINEVFLTIMFGALTPMPFLKHFSPMKEVVANAKLKMKSLHDFYKKTIQEHKNSFDSNNIRDMIDAFLLEMENPKCDKTLFDEKQLTVILADLFLAGSETTGKSLEWACLFMLLYPEVRSIICNISHTYEM